MTPEQDMSLWLSRRNLRRALTCGNANTEPSEVTAYMLVTLARHPERIPTTAAIFLADHFLSHCVGPPLDN